MSKRYQSDLTDEQWAIIQPLIPAEKEGGRPRTTDMREVMNAIFYSLRTGCQWDYLPKCFPPKSTVYDYFTQWRDDGVLDDMMRVFREEIRTSAGRNPKPSAGIIDSQTVKTAGPALEVGFDGGYTGNKLVDWAISFFNVVWKVVKRPRKIFKIVKFRCIVERTFGWMNYQRRLSKDYEFLPKSSEAFIKLSAIGGMLRRISPG